MNHFLFELFRGGIIFEVATLKQALVAQQTGAVAVLLSYNVSPIFPNSDAKLLKEILEKMDIPVLCSFHPGHFIEAELLKNVHIWGLYADSRLDTVRDSNYNELFFASIPLMRDVKSIEHLPTEKNYLPVLRIEHNTELVLEHLTKKEKHEYVFVAGGVHSLSDVVLLKRSGADVIIINNSVFSIHNPVKHLHHLVQASLFFDNAKKLLHMFEEE